MDFSVRETSGTPVLSCHWDFGDGVALDGKQVKHAWTKPGDYAVHVTAAGLDGKEADEALYRARHRSGEDGFHS